MITMTEGKNNLNSNTMLTLFARKKEKDNRTNTLMKVTGFRVVRFSATSKMNAQKSQMTVRISKKAIGG